MWLEFSVHEEPVRVQPKLEVELRGPSPSIPQVRRASIGQAIAVVTGHFVVRGHGCSHGLGGHVSRHRMF